MPKICVEFDPDNGSPAQPQIRTYSTLIGTGSQTAFTIDHNLGVREVALLAYDVATGEVRTDVTAHLLNAERATLTFDAAPSANGVQVYATGVRPVA